jgi:hypothetical protein
MVPALTLFFPLPLTLLFVGIIHLCGDIWKMILFRTGIRWKIILGFGLSGIAMSYLGASLTLNVTGSVLKRTLGAFLLLYVIFLFMKKSWRLPTTWRTSVCGGALSGFFAGIFGVGGAVRGAFLTAFDLPKGTYIFTSGIIAFVIDVTRITHYLSAGTRLEMGLIYGLLLYIPVSLLGAAAAKRTIDQIPQRLFRLFIAIFLGLVAFKFLAYP